MYVITKDLEIKGFSINTIDQVIARNNGSTKFNTLDFFVILLVYSKSTILVDGVKYEIDSNKLVFLAPHRNIDYLKGGSEIIVITFSNSFYEKSAKDSFILNSELFFNNKKDVFISQPIGNKENLKSLIIDRINLYKDKAEGIYIAVAHNCVEILLLDGLLTLEENTSETYYSKSSYIEIVNKYRILLQKYFKTEKSVSFYSDKLNVSPQRLSIMTKNVLGKGAKKVIVDKIVSEVIRMLENSMLNISEIASDLGFLDEANFSTFVKKNLGKSPSEMRDFLLKSEKNTN